MYICFLFIFVLILNFEFSLFFSIFEHLPIQCISVECASLLLGQRHYRGETPAVRRRPLAPPTHPGEGAAHPNQRSGEKG